MDASGANPINVFISYSHENGDWLIGDKIKSLLPFWQRALSEDNTVFWYDRDSQDGLRGSDRWNDRIVEELNRCDIAILLITQDFIISPFIRKEELPILIQRAKDKQIELVPILVEPAEWQDLEIHRIFQFTPGDPTPLSEYLSRSEHAWKNARLEVWRSLKRAIQIVRKKKAAQSDIAKSDGSRDPQIVDPIRQTMVPELGPIRITAENKVHKGNESNLTLASLPKLGDIRIEEMQPPSTPIPSIAVTAASPAAFFSPASNAGWKVLANGENGIGSFCTDQQEVYFFDSRRLRKVSVASRKVDTLHNYLPGIGRPIAMDGYLYWISRISLERIRIGASENETMMRYDRDCIEDFRIDKKCVYWVGKPAEATQAAAIFKRSQSGGKAIQLAGTEHQIFSFIVDDQHVYWCDNGCVRRLEKTGGDVETLARKLSGRLAGFHEERIIWLNSQDNSICLVPKNWNWVERKTISPGGNFHFGPFFNDFFIHQELMCLHCSESGNTGRDLLAIVNLKTCDKVVILVEDVQIGQVVLDSDWVYLLDRKHDRISIQGKKSIIG